MRKKPPVLFYELKYLKLSEIKIDEADCKAPPKKSLEQIQRIMEEFGYFDNIVVDKNHVLVSGKEEFFVLQKLGVTEKIPVIIAKKITSSMHRIAIQHIKQKTKRVDVQKEAEDLRIVLKSHDLDEFSEILGVSSEMLKRKVSVKDKNYASISPFSLSQPSKISHKKDLAIPVAYTNLKLHDGDIFKLGQHRIMFADCTVSASVKKLLKQKTVDELITDPPYGINYSEKNDFLNKNSQGTRIQTPILNDNLADYSKFFADFLQLIPFSDYNTSYIFMNGKELHTVRNAMESAGMTWADNLVWVKNTAVFGRKDYKAQHEFIVYGWKGRHKFFGLNSSKTCIFYPKNQVNNLHPTMKPVGLIEDLVLDGSSQGMLVYDPFLGSGTTLIACEKNNRICYGIEQNMQYFCTVLDRWELLTGKQAIRISDGKKWQQIKQT